MKLEPKRNVMFLHRFFHVSCVAFVFLFVLIVASPVFSIKVKDNNKPAETPSGTLITIDTLEQISSRSATSTVEIDSATSTVVIGAATATVVVDIATATVAVGSASSTVSIGTATGTVVVNTATGTLEISVVEQAVVEEPVVAPVEIVADTPQVETPAVQTAETQDESVEAIPEAQQSNRYKDKLKEVRGEKADSETEPDKTPEEDTAPSVEVVAEEKPPVVSPPVVEKPAETPVVETTPVEAKPSEEAPVVETVAEPAVPVEVAEQPAVVKPAVTEEVPAVIEEKVVKEDVAKPPVAAEVEKAPVADVPPAPQPVAKPQPAEREPTIQIAEPPTLETDKKEPVVKKPEPQKQPEKAKAPVAEKAVRGEAGFYTVRSGPITDENEKEEMVRRLTLENYHPAVKEVSVKEGRKYYILEMGAFKDATLAAGLLYQLRNIPGEFFIINPDGENVDSSEGLVPVDRAGRLIPHRSGELGDNSLALISDYASREGRAPASMDAPIATGPRKMQRRQKTPQYIHDIDSGKEKEVRVEGLTLSNKLRDIAWELREGGYGVYLEQETFLEKEGVLVGVMEDKVEAKKLGEELLGYGYAVNIIYEGDGKYYVYADIENPAHEITIVDKELLMKHGVTDEFVPPPDPMADNLLRLIPKKIR